MASRNRIPEVASKLWSRVQVSGWSAARHLTTPMVQLAAAWLVVRFASPEIWGAVVVDLIVVGLSVHFVSWGNRDYLLRDFGLRPAEVGPAWRRVAATRGGLLLVVLTVAWGMGASGWLLVWILAAATVESTAVLVVYSKRFRPALLADLLGAGLLGIGLWYGREDLEATRIVRLFALATILRAAVLCWQYRPFVFARKWRFDLRYLAAALPFVALGLTGLLQSKADLYLVALLLTPSELGVYQVTIAAFAMMQATAGFALAPYARSIYRLSSHQVRALGGSFLGVGLVGLAVAVPAALWVLRRGFGFDHGLAIAAIGAAVVLPSLLYLPIVYRLFGLGHERSVLIVNVVAAIGNATATWVLAPRYSIAGALTAAAIGQWLVLGGFALALAGSGPIEGTVHD